MLSWIKRLFFVLICQALLRPATAAFNFSSLDLPEEHLPFYFKTFPSVAEECRGDPDCPFKNQLDKKVCWGYEPDCQLENAFQTPSCPGDHKGWVKSKEAQIKAFYTQADFGYLKEQDKQIKILCEPLFKEDSALECSDHLRFCRGRNIMINFTQLALQPARYKMDVLKPGQIGGYCTLHEARMKENLDHLSPLQSWAPEMRNFERILQRPIQNDLCDIVIEKPTYILKIDAAVNMYHHFCDFFNFYASLHLNSTHPDAFSTDVNIVVWETYQYQSAFSDAFKAFTRNPILDLNSFRGEVVCFKSVVFPLLPRMIFGLFYNTPIVYGCENSGLFKAFSQFMLHRLKIPRRDSEYFEIDDGKEDEPEKIRITVLSRKTAYRQVLNEEALLEKLRQDDKFIVKKVEYSRKIPFPEQIAMTHNSDIFIGMHGAGLTHLLFLPDWAVLFEIYNCEDEHCYKDLARLRGVKYMTWTNSSAMNQQDEGHHPDGGAHAKFTNYEFDPDEFVKKVNEAAEHVSSHKSYLKYLQKIKLKHPVNASEESVEPQENELSEEPESKINVELQDEHDEL
ncbi:EGF domain-specific O-linked N-acetylglucosamine transferase [Neocloeon triangulifer]|uniref:EGF domain-specific O-linked N-acetylglucosamine transferase n=1 Tax=Neocloeon triangulifer TaxID=2078957 RepID=UPI00286F4E32|nr:EGF domain-specific O-linked N-acetylglucosamine transferase [Neocloeon triangulifer]